jgi:hypothetical protein
VNAKPTTEDLGIDPDALDWQRSGPGNDAGSGSIEVAFVRVPGAGAGREGPAGPAGGGGGSGSGAPKTPADWVLMRVAGDPDHRVLVFDRNEWECFLDGARNGEFDDAAGDAAS